MERFCLWKIMHFTNVITNVLEMEPRHILKWKELGHSLGPKKKQGHTEELRCLTYTYCQTYSTYSAQHLSDTMYLNIVPQGFQVSPAPRKLCLPILPIFLCDYLLFLVKYTKMFFPNVILLLYQTHVFLFRHSHCASNWSVFQWFVVKGESMKLVKDI